jgi:hypothetical protein
LFLRGGAGEWVFRRKGGRGRGKEREGRGRESERKRERERGGREGGREEMRGQD